MENFRKILKYFSVPILMFAVLISFAGYMGWKEYKIKDRLITEALEGNRYAISILAQYEKPWKLDEQIVNSAIQGNLYALEILKIAPTSDRE